MPDTFNPPPGWPPPPKGWVPPVGWQPDPSWPPAPPGWRLWVTASEIARPYSQSDSVTGAEAEAEARLTALEAEIRDRVIRLRGIERQLKRSADALTAQSTTEKDSKIPTPAPGDEIDAARLELSLVKGQIDLARTQLIELDDEIVMQRVGVYHYRHPLDNSPRYKEALTELRDQIKQSIKSNAAVTASDSFVFDNSLALGRRMVSDYSKLILRAFNAEADACVRSLRAGALETAEARVERSSDSIANLGKLMDLRVTDDYIALRKKELELTADYLMKVQEEKEEEREKRARLREERLAEKEIAAEREKLKKEGKSLPECLPAVATTGPDSRSFSNSRAPI